MLKTGELYLAAAASTVTLAAGCSDSGKAGGMPHRYIDRSHCIGCGQCVPLCPMDAITFEEKANIDSEQCAECGVCRRSSVCPVDAIKQGNLKYPRILREVFSNPLSEHEVTGVPGRGTAGIKTNDSEIRYGPGDIGVFLEFGRPVPGARFRDVDRSTRLFTSYGYRLIEENPIHGLMTDASTGALKEEVLNEKVISCVLEFIVPRDDAARLMKAVRKLGREVDSVFNVCVALRADDDGSSPVARLFPQNTFCLPQAKVNIGIAAGINPAEEG